MALEPAKDEVVLGDEAATPRMGETNGDGDGDDGDDVDDGGGGSSSSAAGNKKGSFLEPLPGTPAFEALEANRGVNVSRFDKHVVRHVKRPKKKHVLGNTKKAARKQRPNVKGKVIDGEHEQYLLSIGMMTGIRTGLSSDGQKNLSEDPLKVRDFNKVVKLAFPPGGSRKTPPHKLSHTFKFKDYCPKAFRAIREMYGIDNASYMNSVCGDASFIQFMANSRSGQFFFYSNDGAYMIKTQTKQENKFLRRILPHYYKHLTKYPDSMLCRFYGMHRVKMYHLRRKLHFVVMKSVFDSRWPVHRMYDLKGSTKGRAMKPHEAVGKDLDIKRENTKVVLGAARKKLFEAQLRADADFLRELKIMDYSLLVGIHDRSRREADLKAQEEERLREGGGLERDEGDAAAADNDAGGSGGGYEAEDHADDDGGGGPPPVSFTKKGSASAESTDLGGSAPSDGPEAAPPMPPLPAAASDAPLMPPPPPPPNGGGGGGGGGGGMFGRRGSNTPLVRQKSSRSSIVKSPTSPDPANTEQQLQRRESSDLVGGGWGGGGGGEDEDDREVTEDDYDTDELSSESESEEYGSASSRFRTIFGGGSGGGDSLDDDLTAGVPVRLRLPAKPLGELDDLVEVPRHSIIGLANRRDGGISSKPKAGGNGTDVYFVGIIDILQQYNTSKYAETMIKSVRGDRATISCVPPGEYADRFVTFLSQFIE